MSAGIIVGNLADLREMQSRFAGKFVVDRGCSDSNAISNFRLPTTNSFREIVDHIPMRIVVIQIATFVWVVAQIVKFALVFIAQTKFPTIGRDDCTR